MSDETCEKDGLSAWQFSLGELFVVMTGFAIMTAVATRDMSRYSLATAIYSALVPVWLLGLRRVFRKADQPGWAAFVPIYNVVIMTRIGGFSAWCALLWVVPFINILVILGISVSIARRFGRGDLFGVGLAFFPQVFYPILGFGGSQYNPDAIAPDAPRADGTQRRIPLTRDSYLVVEDTESNL